MTFINAINPISEGIQNHEVLKGGAIEWPPHEIKLNEATKAFEVSKQGFWGLPIPSRPKPGD